MLGKYLKTVKFDTYLTASAILLSVMGLAVIYNTSFFGKQIIWIGLAVLVYLVFANLDAGFLKNGRLLMLLFSLMVLSLVLVLFFGIDTKGARSRFEILGIAIQPSDPVKLVLILTLAKYLSRRHIEIANFKHILITSVYTFIPFVLIAVQPDLGSAVMLGSIWFVMILLSGISKKHLFILFMLFAVGVFGAWNLALKDYQKARIMSFIEPLQDIQGTGYNAYQSTIAIGSGGLFGKGMGFGTQTRLSFLPEYYTDFVFAAFAEEWGLIGVFAMFLLFATLIGRILYLAIVAKNNITYLFAVGAAGLFFAHFTVNIGMNLGVLPVTGVTLPFVSYGGSHLLTEYAILGILTSFAKS